MKKLNVDLAEITKTKEGIINFQTELLLAKYNNDILLKERTEDIIFVERSLADVFAYCKHWLHNFPTYIDKGEAYWLHTFWIDSIVKNYIYDLRLIIKPNLIPLENDGVRPTFKQDGIHKEMLEHSIFGGGYIELEAVSIEDRVDEVISILKEKELI